MSFGCLRCLTCLAVLLAAEVAASQSLGQASGPLMTIPAGTPLELRLTQHVPMRSGTLLQAVLMYPVYVQDRMVLPAGTRLTGAIVALAPDKARRLDARLNADFTPFHRPVVRFDHLLLDSGRSIALSTSEASDGAPLLHLSPPAAGKKTSLIRQQWDSLLQRVKETKEAVFSPGKGDRLRQLIYSQLPYHPERVERGTTWSCEVTAPVAVPASSPAEAPDHVATASGKMSSLLVHSYLDEELSSEKSKVGSTFEATVAEPVRDADHQLLIPAGSVLVGAVTRARPAKRFGRAGVLRFDFRQLRLPEGAQKQVTGSLAGIDTASGTKLQMDAEGEVKPQQQSKVLVPLAMIFLASRPLDDDGSQLAGATVGSNGLGFIGRIVGMASASRDLAAGIGFYGTAISVYRRWIRRGRAVEFPKYNRIDVEISEQTGRELVPR
jgi:hypothetical protein